MNKKNVLVMVLAMLLVAMISVGGTIAWLTAASTEVTNTFTVGDIVIELKETPVEDNKATSMGNDSLTSTENSYKIIPGDVVDKNPTVIVKENSEKCYVFVTVKNDMKIGDVIVATPNIDSTKWQIVETATDGTVVYAFISAEDTLAEVNATSATQYCEVFNKVTISDIIVTDANINTLANKQIVIKAYAIQSENLTEGLTVAQIWNLAKQ